MSEGSRSAWRWVVGALVVILLVLAWLWWTTPEQDLLPSVYSVL